MMERTSSDEEPAAGSNRTACSISEVGRHDVLCGRGGKVMSHEGNILFRRAVEQRRAEYSSASKERKREIAQSILNDVQGRGGRFIQAMAHVAGAYDRVSDSKALDKCFHALREKKSEAQQVRFPIQTLLLLVDGGIKTHRSLFLFLVPAKRKERNNRIGEEGTPNSGQCGKSM